ncbi:hypothetical protein M3Y99_01053000 [Aphelenchoides fujianensis]|nr:hypothetical protein M3Y99_01053000 [Aphelenchoides fujianensis]
MYKAQTQIEHIASSTVLKSLVLAGAKQMDTVRMKGVDYVTFVARDDEGEFQLFLGTFGQNKTFPYRKNTKAIPKARLSMYVNVSMLYDGVTRTKIDVR